MDKTAIVILNWNGCEMMKRFLPSVIRHSSGSGREVYVADNGSTDHSVSWLKENHPEVHIIILDYNYGFAEGYNQALSQIEAQYVVLLNSDVEVTEHWLTPLETYMDAHPDTAGCQPKIRSWHQPDYFEYAGAAGGFIDRYGYPYCRGRIQGKVERDTGQYDTVSPVFWATGAALFIRLDEYRNAGGLDSRFFAHMEEIDLCWRLRARGKQLVCIPQSVVYHVGGGTLHRENPQKTFLNFRNNLLMLYKNLPERELKPVMRTRTLLDAAASISFFLKGQWGNARAVCHARREFRKMLPSYKAVREENLRLTIVDPIRERSKGCVLFMKNNPKT
jgi:GT2 family glycosyltransferase